MENLPHDIVKRIMREAADEDSIVIDEGPGEVSSEWLSLAKDMKQSWIIHIRADMTAGVAIHGNSDGFAHYDELASMFLLMIQRRSQPDFLQIIIEGDNLSLPQIPAELRAGLRKIQVLNKGTISLDKVGQRNEIPLPLGLFDASLFPRLKKLIAPSHALPRTAPRPSPNLIETLECYYREFAWTKEGPFQSLRMCPSLEKIRVHAPYFPTFHTAFHLPTHVTHFWFKSDLFSFSGEAKPHVQIAAVVSLLRDNPQLIEVLLSKLHFGTEYDTNRLPFPSTTVRRVALVNCDFPEQSVYDAFRAFFVTDLEKLVLTNVSIGDQNPRPTKRARYEGKILSLLAPVRINEPGPTLDQFVPQDGRSEYDRAPTGPWLYMLPVNTTLFHSRVNPSPEKGSSAHEVYSKFFGLTLSHPSTVLIQHLMIDSKHPTGNAHIYEYESIAPIKMKNFGYNRYDELVLPDLTTENLNKFLRVKRSYYIKRDMITDSPILAFQQGNDGTPVRTSVPGRWVEPTEAVELVRVGPPHFDSDYLHMTQFWYKMIPPMGMRMSQDFMAIQAILCGVDRTGPGGLELHAYYMYDTGKRFKFLPPILYRDEDSVTPRLDMPYCIGVLVVYTGTRNYDKTGKFQLTDERKRFAPIEHQGEIIGLLSEKGYEERVWTLADGVLSGLNWEKGHPIRHKLELELFPLFQDKCKEMDIVL